MSSNQVQIRLSVSERFNVLLKSKAARLGLPVTQLIKYILTKNIEEEIPTYKASNKLEKLSEKAINELDRSVVVGDIEEFFDNF
ncbi:hypothetical protein B6D29_02210 [Microgenomates bacterium UTCPR1]|nr:MAG: hypothetical protein B6D29_02210 [Microgenomates bacterium UTCPR1]